MLAPWPPSRKTPSGCGKDKATSSSPITRLRRRTAQGEEIAEGVLCLKSIASVNAVDTGDGLVMLDTGGEFDIDTVHREIRGWRPDAPVHAAVYSHHHVDHVFGTKRFEEEATEKGWPQPVVYAHEDLPSHFDRYTHTLGWNTAINKRQFGLPVDGFRWPEHYRYPDVTYKDRLTFTRGDLTFHLHHGRGETDDATWTWVPERKIVHPGDLFIWAVPNAGNPQKVQRYASDWAASLRQMAGLGAGAAARRARPPDLRRRSRTGRAHRHRRAARITRGADAHADEHGVHARPRDPRGRGARPPPRQALPASGLRPPPVHRAQRVASLRRLVRRRARQPVARAARRSGARSGSHWPVASRRSSPAPARSQTKATCASPATWSSTR